jgi:hypothetical protein
MVIAVMFFQRLACLIHQLFKNYVINNQQFLTKVIILVLTYYLVR